MVYSQTYLREIYLNYLNLLVDVTIVVLVVGCVFRSHVLTVLQVMDIWRNLMSF